MGKFLDGVEVNHDQADQIRLLVTHDNGVGDIGGKLQFVFPFAGRDVLATGRDDDVFHAVGDAEESICINGADIAGVQPAVCVNGFSRFLGLVEVASKHVFAAHANFTGVSVNAHFVVVCRAPDGTGLEAHTAVGRGKAAGFGHAPRLKHGDTERHVPADQFR